MLPLMKNWTTALMTYNWIREETLQGKLQIFVGRPSVSAPDLVEK